EAPPAGPDHLRDRAPPVDDPERRPDPRPREGRGRRARDARRADGARRPIPPAARPAVPLRGRPLREPGRGLHARARGAAEAQGRDGRAPSLMGRALARSFYTRPDVLAIARDLLGKLLVVRARGGRRVSGIIVETEAYRGPEDLASHARLGRRTLRTE